MRVNRNRKNLLLPEALLLCSLAVGF